MQNSTVVGVDWTGASTLEECVVKHFERRTTDSEDFQVMLNRFGKDKMAKFWEAWTERKKHAAKNCQEKVQNSPHSVRAS